MDTNVQATANFTALLVIALVLTLLFAVPSIIAWWRLYEKASKPGWASIIPVYSSIVMAQIAQKPVWMGVVVGVAGIASGFFLPLNLVVLVLGLYLLFSFMQQYDRNLWFWAAVIFLPIVGVFMVKNANYTGTPVTPAVQPTPPASSPVA